ncbi:MAG: primosomal protein N' [Nitrospirota bacterium]
MPPTVEVLLPRPIAHPFHYSVPESLQAQAQPGVRAVVPFGHELLTGVIVRTTAPPPAHAEKKLRSVHRLLDEAPLLSPELLELLRRSADYYAAPWGEVLRSALPSPLLPSGERRFRCREASAPPAVRGSTARRLIELLCKRSNGLTQRTLLQRMKPIGPSKVMSALRRLVAKQLIDIDWKINPLRPESIRKYSIYNSTIEHFYAENNQQISHFETMLSSGPLSEIKHNDFRVFIYHSPDDRLDHYILAASGALQADRSVLLLAPEISRAAHLADALRNRIGGPVFHLGDDPALQKRARQWLALREAAGPLIVVGSRSALFAPVPSLGLIIVDEEADPLYKQEERPRLHARDVAILRAQRASIPILLCGRFISVETYWNGQAGKYTWIAGAPANFSGAASTRLIDLRFEPLTDGLLTKPLIDLIDDRLARGEQTLLFVNRRGYAPGLICRDCGNVLRCATCRTALAYRKTESNLQCRYCHFRMAAPTVCPGCLGHRLGPFGTGTQRAEEALHRRWPNRRMLRIDRDAPMAPSTSGASELDGAELLIGTQLCLHRPAPPRLSLIAVLDAELDLSRPDFRAEERAVQLLTRLRGLLNPAGRNAILLLQSRQPDRPALQALAANGPARFYDAELAQRRALGYPPLTRLATVRLRGQAERLVKQLHALVTEFTSLRLEVWGPIPAPAPHRGAPEWEWLLKAPTASAIQRAVGALQARPPAARLAQHGALQIEIDPL